MRHGPTFGFGTPPTEPPRHHTQKEEMEGGRQKDPFGQGSISDIAFSDTRAPLTCSRTWVTVRRPGRCHPQSGRARASRSSWPSPAVAVVRAAARLTGTKTWCALVGCLRCASLHASLVSSRVAVVGCSAPALCLINLLPACAG